jgi:hypothetical protein
LTRALAAAFLLVALFFIHRSFYGMRIESVEASPSARPVAVKA